MTPVVVLVNGQLTLNTHKQIYELGHCQKKCVIGSNEWQLNNDDDDDDDNNSGTGNEKVESQYCKWILSCRTIHDMASGKLAILISETIK